MDFGMMGMNQMGLSSLASGGLNLFGGHLADERAEERARWSFEQNSNLQREFAQHGIQWRVADAQAAGVHPVYALSGSGAAASPIPVMGESGALGKALSSMGQDISRSVRASMTPEQRAEHEAKLAMMNANTQKDQAIAAFYASRAGRNAQEDGVAAPQYSPMSSFWSPNVKLQATPDNLVVQTPDQFGPGKTSAVNIEADKTPSVRAGDPSLSAGAKPFWSEYTVTDSGLKMKLPYSQEGVSEALEGVPWYWWPGIIAHNIGHYGADWGMRMMREFVGGQAPTYVSRGARGSMYDPEYIRYRDASRGHGRGWKGEFEFRSRGGPTGFE